MLISGHKSYALGQKINRTDRACFPISTLIPMIRVMNFNQQPVISKSLNIFAAPSTNLFLILQVTDTDL